MIAVRYMDEGTCAWDCVRFLVNSWIYPSLFCLSSARRDAMHPCSPFPSSLSGMDLCEKIFTALFENVQETFLLMFVSDEQRED